MDVDIRESSQAEDKPPFLAKELPGKEATDPWPSAAAADTAVSLSASKQVTSSSAVAHIMPDRKAPAVSDMPDSKHSASDSLPRVPDSRAAVAKAAPALPAATEHGVNGKATSSQPASPSSEALVATHDGRPCQPCLPSPGAKGGSPKSSLAYIPLGKAVMAKQEAEAKLAAPKGTSPKAGAHAASAAAGKAAKRQPARGGAKSMLQLDSVSRPASRKRPAAALASEHSPVSQASPQPVLQATGSPAQSSARQQASSSAHPSAGHPSSAATQAASSPVDRASPGHGKAAKPASQQPRRRQEALRAKQPAAMSEHTVVPQLTKATDQCGPPCAALAATKAEQPALSVVPELRGNAEVPHSAPAPAKAGLPVTSRLTGILGKPERPGPKITAIKADIPVQATQPQHRAESPEERQQREEQKQQKEEQRRADEQRRVLREVGPSDSLAPICQRTGLLSTCLAQGVPHDAGTGTRPAMPPQLCSEESRDGYRACSLNCEMDVAQIEAGLDHVTVSAPAIREMTTLVLRESARGLEPRIVRSIVERIEQVPPPATAPLPTPVCPRSPSLAAMSVP